MAREIFSLLCHTIKMINECEWASGGLAMRRNNHLSLLPIDFKVMIREDLGNLLGEILTREGQPCNAAPADEPINQKS
jgi:hypothetical protein